ncbi:MAG: DUF72 domain-containing protein [Thermoprotei archaeon]|nr:MAG: DUF72 domain-containing protein [Thermoprotei archaeon]
MIKVGTCGWSARGGRKAYFQHFNVIEVQETFYRLPREATVRRWRDQAPPDFEYTVKAWQAITHPPSSPTWRRSGLKIPPEARGKYGYFRPTDEVYEAWRRVRRVCEVLRAKVCVFQTPPSFGFSEENMRNVEQFFSTIERGSIKLGWEPRGTWSQHLDELRKLLERLDVTHVVDPLRRRPVYAAGFTYFRLHGLGGREVNYRYKYTDEDLKRLLKVVREYERGGEVYVMFNNVYMFDDALRFKKLLTEAGHP